MNDQIKQIAQRLRMLRDVLEFSISDVSQTCGITEEGYIAYESGDIDIPVSVLHSISSTYHIELSTLLSGEEPHVKSYAITRKNKGLKIERREAYQYQSLGSAFVNKKAEPFLVTVQPKGEENINQNTHQGEEFNMIIEGSLEFIFNNKHIILNEGDSIYFNSEFPHAMNALNNKACKFLAIIL